MTTLSFRIDESELKQLDRQAKSLGLKRSELVRKAIAEFQDRQRGERLATLSRQLAAHTARIAAELDGTAGDGLDA